MLYLSCVTKQARVNEIRQPDFKIAIEKCQQVLGDSGIMIVSVKGLDQVPFSFKGRWFTTYCDLLEYKSEWERIKLLPSYIVTNKNQYIFIYSNLEGYFTLNQGFEKLTKEIVKKHLKNRNESIPPFTKQDEFLKVEYCNGTFNTYEFSIPNPELIPRCIK